MLIVNSNTLKEIILKFQLNKIFKDFVDNKKIVLIYFNYVDSLVMDSKKHDLNFIGLAKKTFEDLKFTWWGEVKFGEHLKKTYNNKELIDLHHPFIHYFQRHSFYNLIRNVKKTNTFFSLIRLHESGNRPHRQAIVDKMKGSKYHKQAIIRTQFDRNYADVKSLFPKEIIESWHHGELSPVPSYYEKTYFELVCETLGGTDHDDTFFFTEKTIKTIAMGHPFIVLSTKHYLKNLKELGFQTFGDFIDESYDDCDTVQERVDIISKNLERLDMAESKKFYENSQSIREHNQKHLLYLYGRYHFDLWKKLDEFFANFE